jgi:hypothetical protein
MNTETIYRRRVISFHPCEHVGITVRCETKHLFLIILKKPVGHLNNIQEMCSVSDLSPNTCLWNDRGGKLCYLWQM